MKRARLSTVRQFMMWFFDEPSNDPYVSLTMDVQIGAALAFLDAYQREHGERIGLQHLATAAVARCLRDVPALNVRILNRVLYQLDHVHVAVPVHLGASEGADETGMVVLRDVDRMSLADLARATRGAATAERTGEPTLTGSAVIRRLAGRVPRRAFAAGLDVLGALGHVAPVARLLAPATPSTAVTNVGAVFALPPGARFRAMSAHISDKAGHVASVFGLAPASDEAVVEDGQIVARRVLPIAAVVDHRAIDGYLMAKAGEHIARSLLDPSRLVVKP